MDRPKLEVSDVLRCYGEAYREQHSASLSTAQRRVMSELCRTAALGSHLEKCDQCQHERICYDSCRNRHCPKCQSLARAQWIENRQEELLDTEYFHVVFTLPEEIAAIAYQNREVVYGILFRAASETLRAIAADSKHLGAEIGFFAVLHSFASSSRFTTFRAALLSFVIWPHYEKQNGLSTPSRPLPVPSKYSTTWAATPIAWRFPIIACSTSKMAECDSATKTIAMKASRKS